MTLIESSGMCIMSELRPCVRLTDDFDRVLGNVNHVGVETVFSELLRLEMSHGDVRLLIVCVPGDLNQLHAVEECRRDRRRRVRRRDEQHLRQVKRHVQVAVVGVKSNRTKHDK